MLEALWGNPATQVDRPLIHQPPKAQSRCHLSTAKPVLVGRHPIHFTGRDHSAVERFEKHFADGHESVVTIRYILAKSGLEVWIQHAYGAGLSPLSRFERVVASAHAMCGERVIPAGPRIAVLEHIAIGTALHGIAELFLAPGPYVTEPGI